MKKIWCVSVVILLSACSDGNVNLVKSMPHVVNERYTYEQALEGRDLCEKVTWESFKNDRGVAMVEYNCEIKGAEEFFDSIRDEQIRSITRRFEQNYSQTEGYLERQASQVADEERWVGEFFANSSSPEDPEARWSSNDNAHPKLARSTYFERCSDTERYNFYANCINTTLDRRRADLKDSRENYEESVAQYETTKRKTEITSVNEVLRWIIPDNGNPELEFVGFMAEYRHDDPAVQGVSGVMGGAHARVILGTFDKEFSDLRDYFVFTGANRLIDGLVISQ